MELANVYIEQQKALNKQFALLQTDKTYLIYKDMEKELNFTKSLIMETMENDNIIKTQNFKFTKGKETVRQVPNFSVIKEFIESVKNGTVYLVDENNNPLTLQADQFFKESTTKARLTITAPKEIK